MCSDRECFVPHAWSELNHYLNTIEVGVADARMSLYRIVAHTGGQLILARQHARPSPECPIVREGSFATSQASHPEIHLVAEAHAHRRPPVVPDTRQR